MGLNPDRLPVVNKIQQDEFVTILAILLILCKVVSL